MTDAHKGGLKPRRGPGRPRQDECYNHHPRAQYGLPNGDCSMCKAERQRFYRRKKTALMKRKIQQGEAENSEGA